MFKKVLKKALYKWSPNYSHIRKDLSIPSTWYGSDYGGFYLYEKPIDSNSIIYSVGIGKDISFDISLMEKFKCKVFGYDPTPDSIEWLKQQNLDKNFHFSAYGISDKTGTRKFYLPKNKKYVSGSILNNNFVSDQREVQVKMQCLADAMLEQGHGYIDVLKMDIEGAEYDVISDLVKKDIKINQLLVEIHDRFFENGYKKSKMAFEQLRYAGFRVFAISDSFEEISFVHKSIL